MPDPSQPAILCPLQLDSHTILFSYSLSTEDTYEHNLPTRLSVTHAIIRGIFHDKLISMGCRRDRQFYFNTATQAVHR